MIAIHIMTIGTKDLSYLSASARVYKSKQTHAKLAKNTPRQAQASMRCLIAPSQN